MLTHLTVKNVALIESIELPLGPGLTVLTGETGAGKSILVEALLILIGHRASTDVVRVGAAEAVVEGQWILSGALAEKLDALLLEQDLPALEGGALVVRRVVSREGRSKQQINGALCTVAQLRLVAEPLVDFTGQHAHQQLLRKDAALPLLDAVAGLTDDVATMGRFFAQAVAAHGALQELAAREAEKERRLDVIRFYLDEIDSLSPSEGEDERLDVERRRLQNAGRLRESLTEARIFLADGDDDALSRARQAQGALRRASRDDPSLADLSRSLDEGIAILDDVAHTLQRRADVDSDPTRLLAVEDRLDALRRVMKKHGGSLAGVFAARAALAAERDAFERADERRQELEEQRTVALTWATERAAEIAARRRAAAPGLAAAIERELPALGMPASRVVVAVSPLAASTGIIVGTNGALLGKQGADRVELLFSANAGEEPEPVSQVASGGELSRVLLAVKRVLLERDPVPVSVFDEVDAGVGGAVGEAIGEKLEGIAQQGRQALVITHLPQIACRGEHHLVVEKSVDGGRTVSRVRSVQDDARVDELARMLGGREISVATIEHARDLWMRARASRAEALGSFAERPEASSSTTPMPRAPKAHDDREKEDSAQENRAKEPMPRSPRGAAGGPLDQRSKKTPGASGARPSKAVERSP
jgi:DNA repair protein RecN (Recombination protein N)